jgi:hypothetical protein
LLGIGKFRRFIFGFNVVVVVGPLGKMVVAVTSKTGIKSSSLLRRNVVTYRRLRRCVMSGGSGNILVSFSICCTRLVTAVAVNTDNVTAGINPSF